MVIDGYLIGGFFLIFLCYIMTIDVYFSINYY